MPRFDSAVYNWLVHKGFFSYGGCSSMVEHWTVAPRAEGSNPFTHPISRVLIKPCARYYILSISIVG